MKISEWIYLVPRGVDPGVTRGRHVEALRRHYHGRIPRNIDPTGQKSRNVFEGDLPLTDIIHRAPPEARIIVHTAGMILSPGEVMTALKDRRADHISIETIEPYYHHDPGTDAGLAVIHSMAMLQTARAGAAAQDTKGRFQKKFSDDLIEQVRQAKAAGRHPKDIASQFKISRSYVYKVTKDIPTIPRVDDYGNARADIISIEDMTEGFGLDPRSVTLLVSFFTRYDNDNTRKTYAADLKKFLDFTRQKRELKSLRDITETDALFWKKALRESAKPRTQNRYLSSLRTIFSHLLKKNYIDENPFADITLAKVSAGAVITAKPSVDEVKLIIKEAERQRRHEAAMWKRAKIHRNELALRLMSTSGMRIGALSETRLSDIRQREGRVFIRLKSKGSTDHYEIPLDPETVKAAEEYIEAWHKKSDPSHYLLFDSVARPDRPVRHKPIHRFLQSIVKMLKLNPEITLHSFRVFTAVEWYRAGMGLRDIQQRLNHKSLEHTAKYIAIDQELPPEEFFQKLKDAI